jgi:Glycine zipper
MKKFFLIVTMAFGLTMVSGAFVETQAQEKAVVKHKKGWSHRKKYGVIGAGAGAVTGAVVSKHHAKGAIIGGVVGGAGGYLLGRHKDKKHPTTKRIYKTKRVY